MRKMRSKSKQSEAYLDKVRGCLIGGAAGDALGYPVEFMGEEQLLKRFGEDGITEYSLDSKTRKALISDDTQMTLFTATGLLYGETRNRPRGTGAAPYVYIARHYEDWLKTQEVPFAKRKAELDALPPEDRRSHSWLADEPRLYNRRAPGTTCVSALRSQIGKTPCDPIRHPLNDSKGCGGIMRIAPAGFLYTLPGRDMTLVDGEAANIAALTHGHSLGYMSAAVLAHIVNRLVYPHGELGPKSLEGIVLEARDTVADMFADDGHVGELVSTINLAVRLANSWDNERDCIRELGEGWVAEETLAIAIFCALRHQDDFSGGIVAAVNHSGDSDSTGAVTGNILGALLGYEAIDAKWKKDLELSDIILKIADDFCHGRQLDGCGDCADPVLECERKEPSTNASIERLREEIENLRRANDVLTVRIQSFEEKCRSYEDRLLALEDKIETVDGDIRECNAKVLALKQSQVMSGAERKEGYRRFIHEFLSLVDLVDEKMKQLRAKSLLDAFSRRLFEVMAGNLDVRELVSFVDGLKNAEVLRQQGLENPDSLRKTIEEIKRGMSFLGERLEEVDDLAREFDKRDRFADMLILPSLNEPFDSATMESRKVEPGEDLRYVVESVQKLGLVENCANAEVRKALVSVSEIQDVDGTSADA